MTLLMCAAASYYNVIRISDIAEINPSVLSRDIHGRTALHYAADQGKASAVDALILAGAEVDAVDSAGMSALMRVVRSEKMFWEKDWKHLEVINALSKASPNYYLVDKNGKTLWHHAVSIAELDYNFIPETDDDTYLPENLHIVMPGSTALDTIYPVIATKDTILAQNYPEDRSSRSSETIIAVARQLLLNANSASSLSQQDSHSAAPIHFVCNPRWLRTRAPFNKTMLELLRIIIARKADIYVVDEDGNSALHHLCLSDGTEDDAIAGMKVLVSQGADVNLRNFAGLTSLGIASAGGSLKIVAYLRTVKAQLLARERESSTAAITIDLPNDLLSALDFGGERHDEIYTGILKQPVGSGGEDGIAASLHPQAYAVYGVANTHYQADADRQFPYIMLNSGKRSLAEQVNLYRAYLKHKDCQGPPANPANHPGSSWHNFGMAIDVARGSDSTRLAKALTDAGWVNSVADEGWHYEAQSTAAFSYIEQQRGTTVGDKPKEIALAISDEVTFACNYGKQEVNYLAQQRELRDRNYHFQRQQADLDKSRRDNEAAKQQIAAERGGLGNLQARANALRRDYDAMQYTDCPNHEPYAECTHVDLKRAYDARRAGAWGNYQRAAQEAASRGAAVSDAERRANETDRAIQNGSRALASDRAAYVKDEADFRKLDQKMQRWKQKEMQARSKAAQGASALQTIINQLITDSRRPLKLIA